MKQKQVKIIGLSINNDFGILQSCKIKFDKDNKLIAVKGEVGSGKTTMQKALQLGTLGSEVLKHDKQLYGDTKIDQELQLLDGETPIFVGCKTNDKGVLSYVIYTKDLNGKKVKDPIIDGVALTPSNYLKSLQTALTWRMEELTSENSTVQKRILLDLYKDSLEKEGVIFDKNHPKYVGSILDKIEKAEALRTEKDYMRKQVGGFSKHLLENGHDVTKSETLPNRKDVEGLKGRVSKMTYDIENSLESFEKGKKFRSSLVISDSKSVLLSLKEANIVISEGNKRVSDQYNEKVKFFNESCTKIAECCDLVNNLFVLEIISKESRESIQKGLRENNLLVKTGVCPESKPLIPIENDICTTKDWHEEGEIKESILKLVELRQKYVEIQKEEFKDDEEGLKMDLQFLKDELVLAEKNNKTCDAVDSFFAWQEENNEVISLKDAYARKLANIDTGVDGLKIEMKEVGEKMDIYLMYNGAYSPEYFCNPDKESRKLSSYSGTQKPMICLLMQNYLLSKKAKALRYLWIDNVPIDNKTRELLEKMGEELDLTIFINITGDFNRDTLGSGEILIEGGEVFFKGVEE